MPLPLPNLDVRRWRDLVDEGRALIPRYSAQWTDHNVHDPGITFMELFAAWTERGLYAANRIPERHLLKYLALAGFPPLEARAASIAIAFDLKPAEVPLRIPEGILFEARTGDRSVPWRLTTSLTATHHTIVSIQSFDGVRFLNQLRAAQQGTAFAAFGVDPRFDATTDDAMPAFHLGFHQPLTVGDELTLFLAIDDGPPDPDPALSLRELADERRARCVPGEECASVNESLCDPCGEEPAPAPVPGGPAVAAPPAIPVHHDAEVVWEMFDASGWRRLTPTEITDETRSLTLAGRIIVKPLTSSVATVVGATPGAGHYLRCRLVRGRWDAAPVLLYVMMNAALAVQDEPLCDTLPIAPGAAVPAGLTPGAGQHLEWTLDTRGTISSLAVVPAGATAPSVCVFDYLAPGAIAEGRIGVDLQALRTEPGQHGLVQMGDGLPEQTGFCPAAPLSAGSIEPWLLGAGGWEAWQQRRDLDAAGPTDPAVASDNRLAAFLFGDGMRGRVMPDQASAWLRGRATRGGAGTLPAWTSWHVREGAWNAFVLGASPATFANRFDSIRNFAPSRGGHDFETIDQALHRALDSMWVHERLQDAAERAHGDTLDTVEPGLVRSLPKPARATTVADYERLALAVPGTVIRRARAWGDLDGRMPDLVGPGAVTVVIVPALPLARPFPSRGLIRAVREYLDPRRTLCTRVVVMGPQFVVVAVRARVRAVSGANPERVAETVRRTLASFIDPLQGGPLGRGWPFGRDVYRSEVLQVIDDVSGVDHVESLELVRDGCVLACSNACVPTIALAASGEHEIEVVP